VDLKELYPAYKAASNAMGAIYDPVFAAHAEKYHISTQQICILTAVPTFEPSAVSPALLNIRSPYMAPEHYRALLSGLATAGLLKLIAADQFRLTDQGLVVLKQTLTAVYTAMAGVQSLSVTKMMDLASRLKDMADACLAAPTPPGIWCIQHVRRMDPGSCNPMMARIDQFLSELVVFRDDAHLASWRHHGCSGHAWDILTLLWVELEGTGEDINQKLKRRGFTLEQTAAAIDELLVKDWLKHLDGKLRITMVGADVRQIAEMQTERYYIERFSGFSGLELTRTLDLIKEHRRGLHI
jgi:hypothetical protein